MSKDKKRKWRREYSQEAKERKKFLKGYEGSTLQGIHKSGWSIQKTKILEWQKDYKARFGSSFNAPIIPEDQKIKLVIDGKEKNQPQQFGLPPEGQEMKDEDGNFLFVHNFTNWHPFDECEDHNEIISLFAEHKVFNKSDNMVSVEMYDLGENKIEHLWIAFKEKKGLKKFVLRLNKFLNEYTEGKK